MNVGTNYILRRKGKGCLFLIPVMLFLSFLVGCKDFSFFSELGIKGGVKISPESITLVTGTSVTFWATGGEPPYIFEIKSGNGTISPDTGIYIASDMAGTDTIQVTDNNGHTATATVIVTMIFTNVDYTITSISFPATATAGGTVPAGYFFRVQNTGSAGGGYPVNWRVYISEDGTLGGGDLMLCSGTTPALPAGATSPDLVLTGTWPYQSGSHTLFVTISALDDLNTVNNTSSGSSLTLSAPDVDYQVLTVSVDPGVQNPGQTVSGSFQYENIGIDNGYPSQKVNWQVYASLNTTIDADDTWIDSGEGLPALDAGVTSAAQSYSGTWPLDYGDYYLIVRVSCPEDIDTSNNWGDNGSAIAVGYFDESVHEPNDDYIGLSDFYDLQITFQPGMSIHVAGSLGSTDTVDIMAFDTGTCTMITFAVSWSSGDSDINIYVMDAPNNFLQGVGGTIDAISLNWTVDASGVMRWVDLENDSVAPLLNGPYTMVITGH